MSTNAVAVQQYTVRPAADLDKSIELHLFYHVHQVVNVIEVILKDSALQLQVQLPLTIIDMKVVRHLVHCMQTRQQTYQSWHNMATYSRKSNHLRKRHTAH